MAIIRNTTLSNVADLIFYLDAVNPKSYSGSGSTWNDLSPNKNHFTLFNTPTYTQNGTIGTYLTFNGTNQYARSTNAINFNAYSAVTIEIGYRSTITNATQILYETTGTGGSTATGGITLLMNANNTSTSIANSYLSQWQGYGPRLFGFVSGTSTFFNAVTEIFVNGIDSTGRTTYVNNSSTVYFTNSGVSTSTNTTTAGLSFSNTWTYIASRAGTGNFFNGDIAWVRAWGTKINNTSLAQNFNSIAVRQPNSYNDFTILRSDPAASAVVTAAISSIFNGLCAYLQGFLTEFQNPSFYSYTLDGNATYITDGGNDMYDGGNFTYPWLISGSNYSTNASNVAADAVNVISYSNDSSSITLDTDFVYRTLGYGTSPDRRPLTVLGYRSGTSKPIGFQKSGNSGADGGGSLSSTTLYNGATVNSFTVYAFHRETYNTGDPSHCDLYMLIGHTNFNSVFGTVLSYADPVSNGGNGGYLYAANSSNVIAVTMLLSKASGVEVTAAECQTVVQNFTSRMKTHLGF
jgi:hypothetical protein